jgi:hypothetical protein
MTKSLNYSRLTEWGLTTAYIPIATTVIDIKSGLKSIASDVITK